MARSTAQVTDSLLTARAGDAPIVVGSSEWFAWLDQAALFAFRCPTGHFTARKEAHARGGAYWRAYRTSGGRQRRGYIGRSADLTPARLRAVAAQLAAAGPADPLASPMLLRTKLYLPRPRGASVPRPHLLARLDAGLSRPLTLLAAPAGFGKTTLLAEWLAQKAEGRRQKDEEFHPSAFCLLPSRVAWLTLDAGDNDPAGFLRYLIAALQTAAPQAGAAALAMLQSHEPPTPYAPLISLINDLAALPQPLLLVLDDYHAIVDPAVHSALAYLIDHQPPSMHLVLASREDPPLPLARLRARHQITELRAADLRFLPTESSAFLHSVMGLQIDAAAAATLAARTEGWAAGLQLAALALHERADPAGFVAAFAGSNRFVIDYLAGEVIDHMPMDLREFALTTSIVSRMCAELCDALVRENQEPENREPSTKAGDPGSRSSARGSGAGRAMLDALERANMFLVALDDQRRWYRYHQLFADALREQLARSRPAAAIGALHRRAGAWFEQQGLLGEAIEHWLAGGAAAHAAGLIEAVAQDLSLDGQHATVGRWLAQLPAELRRTRPPLALAHALVAVARSDWAGAEGFLRAAEAGLSGWDAAQAGTLHTTLAALRAVALSLLGDTQARALGRQALAQLPAEHPLYSTTVAGLSYACFYAGDLPTVDLLLAEATAPAQARRHHPLIQAGLLALLAMVRRAQGRLHETQRLSQAVIELATRDGQVLPISGALLAYLLLGLTHCEQNNLATAERALRQCADLAAQHGVATYTALAGLYLAHIAWAQGDWASVLDLLDRAEQAAPGLLPAGNLREIAGYRALVWLAQGNTAAAVAWAAGYDPQDAARPPLTAYDYDRFALVHVLLAQGQWAAAQTAAQQLVRVAEAGGYGTFLIWALALQALATHAQGAADTATALLARALGLAAPEGYVHVFVGMGNAMANLLQLARGRGVAPTYIGRLLAAYPGSAGALSTPDLVPPTLPEPLSARECEVLRLLAAGHDNQAIARELMIAISTVKSHINHLFGKLGVRSRLAALLRARELGLLE